MYDSDIILVKESNAQLAADAFRTSFASVGAVNGVLVDEEMKPVRSPNPSPERNLLRVRSGQTMTYADGIEGSVPQRDHRQKASGTA